MIKHHDKHRLIQLLNSHHNWRQWNPALAVNESKNNVLQSIINPMNEDAESNLPYERKDKSAKKPGERILNPDRVKIIL